ncbi:hypothetical protein NSE01_17010 [Novosphingobium sediminis]|uniref:Uncharacterized protein n=1 Tax=Novosphingobium sediminis TaxID=707214 RepID=A0A512AJI6_9SPHN|nr:hypothetical protein NSE01_17010 [Novosphingobium sediminis]
MAFQHAEVAFRAGDFDHEDLFRTDEAGRGDEFEVERHRFLTPPSRLREGSGVGRGETPRLLQAHPKPLPQAGGA